LAGQLFDVAPGGALKVADQRARHLEGSGDFLNDEAPKLKKLKIDARKLKSLEVHAVFEDQRFAAVRPAGMCGVEALAKTLQHLGRERLAILEDAARAGAVGEEPALMLGHHHVDRDGFAAKVDKADGAARGRAGRRDMQHVAPAENAIAALRLADAEAWFARGVVNLIGNGTGIEAVKLAGRVANADNLSEGGAVQEGVELHRGSGFNATGPGRPIARHERGGRVRRVTLARSVRAATIDMNWQRADSLGDDAARGERGRTAQRRLGRHGGAGRSRDRAEQSQKLRRRARQSGLFLSAEDVS